MGRRTPRRRTRNGSWRPTDVIAASNRERHIAHRARACFFTRARGLTVPGPPHNSEPGLEFLQNAEDSGIGMPNAGRFEIVIDRVRTKLAHNGASPKLTLGHYVGYTRPKNLRPARWVTLESPLNRFSRRTYGCTGPFGDRTTPPPPGRPREQSVCHYGRRRADRPLLPAREGSP